MNLYDCIEKEEMFTDSSLLEGLRRSDDEMHTLNESKQQVSYELKLAREQYL